MRTLFEHADILLRGEDRYYAEKDAFLAVDGEFIEYIGKDRPAGDFDAVRDMSGKLLMPGLVNTHSHTSMTLMRGVGSDKNLQDWLFNSIFPIEAKLREQDIWAGSALAFAEMISTGTTSVTDMYFYPPLICQLAEQVGIKMNTNDAVTVPGELDDVAESKIQRAVKLYNDWNEKAGGRIKVDVAVHSEYLNSEPVLKRYLELSRGAKTQFHVHLSETASEHRECIERHGKTPIAYFESLGYLDEFPTYCAHCVHVTDEDLEIFRKHGVTIAHNPSSNMKLGSGFAPIRKAMDMGVNVSLGTDGAASNNNLNMFEELHLAAMIHKGYNQDPTALTVTQLLDMATVNGAKAQGRYDTGVLEAGKRADIIAVDMTAPHMYPHFDIPALLCYSAQGSDVCMTMVDGRMLYEDGKFLTLDIEKVMKDAKESADYLLKG